MVLNIFRAALVAAIALFVFAFAADVAQAGGHRVVRASDDLFYNFYVPTPGGMSTAEMYPCPRPVPPWVGYTYITYQPLLPHEFLYKHKRTYLRYHPCGGSTRTRVIWY